jgi:8-oxo-dGTP pyrophosphatase MutT (NUDIX family)
LRHIKGIELKQDESFGVIPLRKKEGRWEVFLIQHNRSGYWGFPKGHAESNETPKQAAFRELMEETHLELVHLLYEEPLMEQYTFTMDGRRVFKRVSYFIAEVDGKVILQQQEIHDGRWIPLPEALNQVTHQEGKNLLIQVEKMLPKI